jgi:membrane protease YdiL (CAAX protease family)
MIYSTKPSRRETLWGGIYLILYMSVLPAAVPLVMMLLMPETGEADMNAVFLGLNFIATVVIFRKYLLQTVKDGLQKPLRTLWYALLGYLGTWALGDLISQVILFLDPEFTNVNDSNIAGMMQENFLLMALGTVVLAPISEELLFRGLIFRGLYDRSPAIAHILTMVIFSMIHVSGYVILYPMKTLFFCFLQYLPIAYCLSFAYRYSGSLLAPILIHMANNLVATAAMR